MLKTELIKEVSELRSKLELYYREDKRMRNEFSSVLNGDELYDYGNVARKRQESLSWEEIFYKIGQLRTDSSLTKVIRHNKELMSTNSDLREKIYQIEHQLKKKC